MKRTPLKVKTGLKRVAMKYKPKRYPMSKKELTIVDIRSGGECEYHGANCPDKKHLVNAHIFHRGMGGVQGDRAIIINNHRNMAKICIFAHDFIDKRTGKLLDINLIVQDS